jgi:transposase
MAWIYLDKNEIAELYKNGATTNELAKRYGVSNETIRQRLKQMEIPRRSLKGVTRENHPKWKNGSIIDRDGYIRTWAPNHPWPRKGYMPEHVRIMELRIGRKLKVIECVHHKNHDRQDNRIENLELMTRSEHSKLHRSKDIHMFKRNKSGRFMCGSI